MVIGVSSDADSCTWRMEHTIEVGAILNLMHGCPSVRASAIAISCNTCRVRRRCAPNITVGDIRIASQRVASQRVASQRSA